MASCITSQWATAAPQIKLTVTQSSDDHTSATLSWTLQYIAGSAASTNSERSYSVKIGGATVKSGSYSINGKKGTYTIASGTKVIAKTTSAQSIAFSCSMAFNLTWGGSYGGTKSASGSISVSKKTSYTVSFNANGGSGAPGSQTKWYGTNLTLSSTKPTRTGYSFLGWSTSASATSATWSAGGTYSTNASDILYAVWKANTYTVSFNANGGSGAPGSQTKTYGKALTLSNTKPTRTNYTFKGWGTSASSTTATYQPGGSYTANASDILYAVWVLAYKKPRITGCSVVRCNSSGTIDESGTCALVKFNWACDNDVTAIKIEWKKSNVSSYSNNVTVTATGKSGSVNQVIGSDSIATDSTYDIRITVTDSESSYNVQTLNGMSFIIDIKSGGTGIAFGKPAETEDLFDVGYESRYRNNITFDNNKKIYGIKPTGEEIESFQAQNENGNTVIGYGNYDIGSGNTNIYGRDINFGVSNISTPGTYRPYYRKGDSITIILRTAGYVTNSGTDLSFWLPLSKPVIGSPTATAVSVDGFVLRQGNAYTHGSGASAFVKPSSYDVSPTYGAGLYIKAVFSKTTNVTNNDAIGIYWSGKITFS